MEQERTERYKSGAQHRSIKEVRWGTTLRTGPRLHEPPRPRKRGADETTRHHRDPPAVSLGTATCHGAHSLLSLYTRSTMALVCCEIDSSSQVQHEQTDSCGSLHV